MRRLRGLARCGGGAPGAPPIYLGSGAKFCPKIMFSWKVASIPTHLTLFQNFFSITPPKISENWKSSEKLLKMGEIFKICNFWAISTCNTSKNRIFHIEFIFKQKKYDLFEKSEKKSNFFDFFFKIDADHLSSNVIFSNLCQKILKLSLPVLWKRFEIKSHQRRAHYLKPRRNGRPIPTGGARGAPPHTD